MSSGAPNKDIYYGKGGDLTGPDKEHAEVSMLALHLLQSALVHVNTALLQICLSERDWADRMTDADRRALSPLFWSHVNLYGKFDLDMTTRLDFGPLLAGLQQTEHARTPSPGLELAPGGWFESHYSPTTNRPGDHSKGRYTITGETSTPQLPNTDGPDDGGTTE